MLLALSRTELTRRLNKVLLYLLLLSDLSEGTCIVAPNTFKTNSCYFSVIDHLCGIHIPRRKLMTSRSKVHNYKPLVLLNIFIIPLKHNREPVHRLSWQRSCIRIEKTSTPPLPCFNIQAIFVSNLYTCKSFSDLFCAATFLCL